MCWVEVTPDTPGTPTTDPVPPVKILIDELHIFGLASCPPPSNLGPQMWQHGESAIAPGVVGADAKRLCAALDRLETLPVVRSAKAEPKPHLGRVICNLWCGAAHVERGERALKQPLVRINKKPSTDAASVPNYLVAAEKLLVKIETEHAGCLVAAEAAKAKAQQHGARSRGQTVCPACKLSL